MATVPLCSSLNPNHVQHTCWLQRRPAYCPLPMAPAPLLFPVPVHCPRAAHLVVCVQSSPSAMCAAIDTHITLPPSLLLNHPHVRNSNPPIGYEAYLVIARQYDPVATTTQQAGAAQGTGRGQGSGWRVSMCAGNWSWMGRSNVQLPVYKAWGTHSLQVVQGDQTHILAAHAIPKRCPTTWSIKLSELVLSPMHIAEACLIASAAAAVVSAGCEAPQTANPLLTAHCDLWYPCTRTPCYTIWKPGTGTWRNRIGRSPSINMIIARPSPHVFHEPAPVGCAGQVQVREVVDLQHAFMQRERQHGQQQRQQQQSWYRQQHQNCQQQQQKTFARCVCVTLLTLATP